MAKQSLLSRLLRFEDVDAAVFSIALPNIISNVSTPMVGLVGSYVAGHLGSEGQMAGVGLGTSSFNVVYLVFIFLQKGTTGLTAQAKGAADYAEVRACAGRFISLGLLMGITLLLSREWLRSVIFTYLLPPPSEESSKAANDYFNHRLLGAPAAFGNFAVQGWLNGMQQPVRVLTQQLVLNITNSSCCFFLSLPSGLGLGATGVGLADAIAQTTAFVFGVMQVICALAGCPRGEKLPGTWDMKMFFNASRLKEGAVLSTNILLRSVCISIVSTSFNRIGSTFGEAVLSANIILAQLQTLMSYGVDGFSNACEALVGEAIGAKSPEDLRKAVFSSFKWGFVLSLAFCCVYTTCGQFIFEHMTSLEEVQQAAMHYLVWISVAPMLTVWSYLLDGVYVGATLSFEMVTSMVICATIYVIVLWLAVYVAKLENHGLLAAFYTFQVMRGITLGRQYHKVKAKAEPEAGYAKLPSDDLSRDRRAVSMPEVKSWPTLADKDVMPTRSASYSEGKEKRSIEQLMRDLLTPNLGPDVPDDLTRQVSRMIPNSVNNF